MHIPDGYLSPATAGTLYVATVPFWYIALRKIQRTLAGRTIPLMALLSAFCFVVQMLNIPLPGGTTGHAVGASLAAIVLTPWPAVLAISIALTIQALLFGDGGITTLGANCFNMAVAQVFVSYYIYRILNGRMRPTAAAAVSGYISINIAALLAGVELGLQPYLAHRSDGTPLYAPYPLSIAVPAMVAGHLVAGFAEAALAAIAIGYLQRSAPELLSLSAIESEPPLPSFWKRIRTVCVILAILIVLTPLGLLAPGTAWGEWGTQQLTDMGLGFVPQGMQRLEGFWSALFLDYSIPGAGRSLGYIFSAVIGVLIIAGVFAIITWIGRSRGGSKIRPQDGEMNTGGS